MTERGDRFVMFVEPPYKCSRLHRLTQQVGIDESAGHQQTVIPMRVGLGHRVIDTDPAGGLMKIDATYAASPERNDVHLGSSKAQRHHGNRQFELFKPVCCEDGDAPAFEASLLHHTPFSSDVYRSPG